MQDPKSVITVAARGRVHELAEEFEVSESRMYEILSKDNPYPKAKRLIRAIARVNPDGLAAIRADLDAMFRRFERPGAVSVVDLHRECSEGVNAILANAPRADQLRELREAQAKISAAIEAIEAGERVN